MNTIILPLFKTYTRMKTDLNFDLTEVDILIARPSVHYV